MIFHIDQLDLAQQSQTLYSVLTKYVSHHGGDFDGIYDVSVSGLLLSRSEL